MIAPAGRGEELGQPAWSPDGSRLAYVRTVDEDRAQVMVLDGNGRHAVTPLRENTIDQAPAWSPDGKALAFGRFLTPGESGARDRTQIVVRDLASVPSGLW